MFAIDFEVSKTYTHTHTHHSIKSRHSWRRQATNGGGGYIEETSNNKSIAQPISHFISLAGSLRRDAIEVIALNVLSRHFGKAPRNDKTASDTPVPPEDLNGLTLAMWRLQQPQQQQHNTTSTTVLTCSWCVKHSAKESSARGACPHETDMDIWSNILDTIFLQETKDLKTQCSTITTSARVACSLINYNVRLDYPM